MVSEIMQQKLNEQVQKEFYSAYLYLSMETYFTSINLEGFANFFRVQAQEERDHAMKFFDFISQAGGRVNLLQIQAPKSEFESAQDVFTITLEHERFVTKSIYDLVDTAVKESDYSTQTFLQWFVTEQREEESNMDNVLKRIKLVGNDGGGLLMIDSQLAQRVYVPIPTQV